MQYDRSALRSTRRRAFGALLAVIVTLPISQSAIAGGLVGAARPISMVDDRLGLEAGIVSLLFATAALAFLGLWLADRLRRTKSFERQLTIRCNALAAELDRSAISVGAQVKTIIDDDFHEWQLSNAENDIAWFMLRGLPLREIAGVRGTSERTVRQQAQAIYRKAGLDGRSDLAGRVLERFI